MYVSASSASRSSGTFNQVLPSPLYGGATIAMFLSGLGASAAAPQFVLFLVKELGTPLPIAGLLPKTPVAPVTTATLSGRSKILRVSFVKGILAIGSGSPSWSGVCMLGSLSTDREIRFN